MIYFAQVLIIDTNIKLYEHSKGIWAGYGIKCNRVDNMEEALKDLLINKYHLIAIVEHKEERQKVLNFIKLFHESSIAPVVIASHDPIDLEYSIAAYDMGVVEVWRMPERIEEAVAKGNAIIKLFMDLDRKISLKSTVIVNNQIIISSVQRLVFVKGNEIDLSKTEFEILSLLITHPGRVFTYNAIFRNVWGEEYTDISKSTLWNHIVNIRTKLKIDDNTPVFIKTKHGVGYSFDPYYDKDYIIS